MERVGRPQTLRGSLVTFEFVFAHLGVALRAAYASLAVLRASLVLTFARALRSLHVIREVVVPDSRAAGRTLHPLAFLVTDSESLELCDHGPATISRERSSRKCTG